MSWATGKTILVTGGSQGIGLATATAFSALGASVHITGTRAAATDYDDDLSGLIYHRADMASDDDRATLAGSVGDLDVLVNNAGTGGSDEYTTAGFARILAINLTAVMDLSTRFHAGLAASKGSIVNVGSLSSFLALKETPAYTASKTGLLGLTRALADKWSGDGIRVNLVAPGFIARLNRITGDRTVTFIDFVIDAAAVDGEAKDKMATTPDFDLSASLIASANAIADENLRERFLATAADYLARQAAQ